MQHNFSSRISESGICECLPQSVVKSSGFFSPFASLASFCPTLLSSLLNLTSPLCFLRFLLFKAASEPCPQAQLQVNEFLQLVISRTIAAAAVRVSTPSLAKIRSVCLATVAGMHSRIDA